MKIEEIKDKINLLCTLPKCCLNQNLGLCPLEFKIDTLDSGNFFGIMAGDFFKTYAMTCRNCGHTNFYSSKILGELEKNEN